MHGQRGEKGFKEKERRERGRIKEGSSFKTKVDIHVYGRQASFNILTFARLTKSITKCLPT